MQQKLFSFRWSLFKSRYLGMGGSWLGCDQTVFNRAVKIIQVLMWSYPMLAEPVQIFYICMTKTKYTFTFKCTTYWGNLS